VTSSWLLTNVRLIPVIWLCGDIHAADASLAGPVLDHFMDTEDKYGYTQNLFPIVQGSVFPDLRKASL
jgi:hypothetical protein